MNHLQSPNRTSINRLTVVLGEYLWQPCFILGPKIPVWDPEQLLQASAFQCPEFSSLIRQTESIFYTAGLYKIIKAQRIKHYSQLCGLRTCTDCISSEPDVMAAPDHSLVIAVVAVTILIFLPEVELPSLEMEARKSPLIMNLLISVMASIPYAFELSCQSVGNVLQFC